MSEIFDETTVYTVEYVTRCHINLQVHTSSQHLQPGKVVVHLLLAEVEIWHYATKPEQRVNGFA
jgi:hypothetical protein